MTPEDIKKIIEHLTVQSVASNNVGNKTGDEYFHGISVGLDEAIYHLNELLEVENQTNLVKLMLDGILSQKDQRIMRMLKTP